MTSRLRTTNLDDVAMLLFFFKNYLYLFLFFIYVYMCLHAVCMYTTYILGPYRGQKKALVLEVETSVVVSHHVGARRKLM